LDRLRWPAASFQWKQPGKLMVWLVAFGYTALVMECSAVQASNGMLAVLPCCAPF
jgi:hypothetical protein